MTPEQLMWWLKGHFELSAEPPSREAWGTIKAAVMAASAMDFMELPPAPMPVPLSEFIKTHPPKGGCGCGGGCK